MIPLATAALDRQVKVIEGAPDLQQQVLRVSDLRSLPFVVLLGEPGIGKTTVLGVEAAEEGVPVVKVRELITGFPAPPGATLFLDALDEYRIDGDASDKAQLLGQAIFAAKADRWRLTCRAEDWRKSADVAAIQRTTAGEPIVVAQLLPLDEPEARAVLEALGEKRPVEFLKRASALGAIGFTESPLSLKLLHKAVAEGGDWPATRHDLFASAIRRLAHERNPEHKWAERIPLDDIITSAGEICLILLVSGSRAIWCSHDEPPTSGGDARAYVTADELRIDREQLGDVLDTALFRGEGEAFEPVHRTVAEFLAGQALARAVVGGTARAAFPLARALALITGEDGKPPTELRGLYAWFAAHLAELGDENATMRLIEADAETVLAYGDAAVFGTPARRIMLLNLDRTDPFFRASEVGVIAVGGLAGEDLADDFAAILGAQQQNTHRLLTVLDALTTGRPVASLRNLLRALALDPTRPESLRLRATEAWLNGVEDLATARRMLFDDLAAETVSAGRAALRAHLAAALPSSALSIADIKSVIADFQRIAHDHTIGRLYRLNRKLEGEPRPELFDEPLKNWLPSRDHRHTVEVESLLDHALAAAIRATPGLTASRLWRWTVDVRDYVTSELGAETAKAVTEWVDESDGRGVAFFDAILAEDDSSRGPWMVGNTYIRTTSLQPSAAIIRHLLTAAATAPTKARANRLLAIAVELARVPRADRDANWETYAALVDRPGCKKLFKRLTVTEVEPWRLQQHRRAIKEQREDAKQRVKNLTALTPVLDDLRNGRRAQALFWAAQIYFDRHHGPGTPIGRNRVMYFTDAATADAIVFGWKHLATVDLGGLSAAMLGAVEAKHEWYPVELAALGGLDCLFDENALPDAATLPLGLAIIVLKSGFMVEDQNRRSQLERWAIARLNVDPSAGAAQLLEYWIPSVDAGVTHLSGLSRLVEDDGLSPAVAQAIDALLMSRPDMRSDLLLSVLRAAARQLGSARLVEIATVALANPKVVDDARALWSFTAFALDPFAHGHQFVAEHSQAKQVEVFNKVLSTGSITFAGIDDRARIYRDAIIIRTVGAACEPRDELVQGYATQKSQLAEVVRRAINWFESNPNLDAATALAGLIEDAGLSRWHQSLLHALSQQTRLRRDRNFRHPGPTAIREAIAGGPPVTAADLSAIVVEELQRLRAELRTNNTMPWKRYWNLNSKGNPIEPRIENECRDNLLDRLKDRLKPYRIAVAIPEARRGEETRTDMLVVSGSGSDLPIEVKRHFHAALWTAPSTQLQGYAAGEGAAGLGVYLVFWFGNEIAPTPARADGSHRPKSAHELEKMLIDDLPPDLRRRVGVIVFDLSDPKRIAKRSSQRKKGRPRVPRLGQQSRGPLAGPGGAPG